MSSQPTAGESKIQTKVKLKINWKLFSAPDSRTGNEVELAVGGGILKQIKQKIIVYVFGKSCIC